MDYVAYHAKIRPHKVAIHELETGSKLTYAALDARVERAVSFLRARVGELAGERISTLQRNRADLLVLQLACARTGAIYAPLNWRLAAPEIAFLVQDAAPKVLVHDAEFEASLAETPRWPDLTVLRISPERDELDEALAAAPEPAPRHGPALIDADAPSIMLYTSGTTGRPKGVLFTERNAYYSTVNFSLASRVDSETVFLCEPPLFHTAALIAVARSTLFNGATLVIAKQFDPLETFNRLADPELGVTNYFCVPQMARMMRNEPGFDGKKLAKLRSIVSGGAPHAAADVRRWVEDGVRMLDGFGMSEVGSATSMPVDDFATLKAKAGSCGVPLLVTQLRIVDEDGNDVPQGEVGELWLRSPTIGPGYWNRPDATSDTRTPDGWFKTGDAGRLDEEGFLYLVDRLKDMYISGGENVYPAEVEAAIAELKGIGDVAVIGVPDEKWGETGVAYVVAAAGAPEGAALTPEAVSAHCRARLARYKLPAEVRLVDALPRNPSGKLLKNVLREQHAALRKAETS
jgi:fatty-acyl-CoA synthase